jgi:hypothetical protein
LQVAEVTGEDDKWPQSEMQLLGFSINKNANKVSKKDNAMPIQQRS